MQPPHTLRAISRDCSLAAPGCAVLSPLFMTQLFSRFSRPDSAVYLPGAPYLVAAALVFLCVLICLRATRPAT